MSENKLIEIDPPKIKFKQDLSDNHSTATIQVTNTTDKNVITKIYVNSNEEITAKPSILLLQPKETQEILFKKKILEETYKKSHIDLLLKAMPVDEETFENNTQLKLRFKQFDSKTLQEKGQKIKVEVDPGFIYEDMSFEDSSKDVLDNDNIKKRLLEVSKSIDETNKKIDEVKKQISIESKKVGENFQKNLGLKNKNIEEFFDQEKIVKNSENRVSLFAFCICVFISIVIGAFINRIWK